MQIEGGSSAFLWHPHTSTTPSFHLAFLPSPTSRAALQELGVGKHTHMHTQKGIKQPVWEIDVHFSPPAAVILALVLGYMADRPCQQDVA